MKRNFTFLMTAFALMVGMMMPLGMKGENYVVQFNSTSGSDGTSAITSVQDIVASGNSYISSISDATRVYKGKSGYGVKLGSGSGAGWFTMNLSSSGKVYATSITFNACYYNTDYSYLYVIINGDEDGEKSFALSSSLSNVTYTFSAPTLVSSIKISGSGKNKRFYVASMTVNYSSSVQTVDTPVFSLEGGTYTGTQNVAISCTTSGATIHYTTDGTTPSTSSTAYSLPIPVSATTTIKAIAVKEGMNNSAVAEATYIIEGGGSDGTIYALYSGNLVEGDYIIYYSGRVMKNTVSSNRLEYKEVTPSNDRITTSDDAIVWHIAPNGNYWTIYNEAVDKYAASTGTKNQAQLLPSDTDDMSLWTVEGNSTYEFVNKKNAANDVNKNLRNNGQYGFACYGIGTGGALSLYRSTAPSIVANQTIELAHDATSGAFDYSITNPVDGTTLTATSNADWISDIQVGDAQVTFTTTVNDTYLERNDTITLTYGTKTKDVIITQAALVPVITVSDAPTDAFPYEGGFGWFGFSIDPPVDEALATAYSAEYWIRNFEVSDDMVSFEVAPSIEDARSGNITLSYMLNGATLASVTVTINQETNPNEHGTFERPYTVTEAWNIIKDLSNNTPTTDTVYVAGTISSINEVEVIQYHNATYYITDGSKTVKVQYGRNLDNTDFYDEDEIQVGDRVVVYGRLMKYNANTYEIAPYNYLVSLERDVEPPLFNPTSCMMANDEAAVVYLYTNNGEEVVIYYTTNGNDPTTSSEIYSGDSGISLQGLTDEVTIKAIAYTLDGTMHSAVNSATYRMVPPYTHGLYDHPFTVQQALDSLDVSSTIEGVYVRGVVCADPEFSLSNFMNANYYIADNLGGDNQLYVFRGRYYGGEPFTSQEELMYGDIVTVFGDLAIYNGQVKEFTAKNYIVEKERPSSVFIRPSEVTTNCRGISSSLNVYYNNLTYIDSSELQFCDAQGIQVQVSTYGWLTASLNSSTGNIDFQIEDNDSNAPRTAYLKLVVEDAGNSTALKSNVVSITQGICSSIDFASLPFHYVGNGDAPAGITKVGLGENYGSSPYLKFDGVNDYMTLAFDEAPGELTFNIKGDKFKSSEFYLQTSTNNLDWDDLAIYTTQDMINSWAADNPKREIARVIGDPMAQSFPQLDANVRYIRWIMMTHSSDSKVRLGEIHLYKPVIYYNIAVTQPTIEETQVGTITTSEMAQENETVNLSIEYNADDYYFVEWVVVDASGNPVAVTDNHFTMPASDVNVTATLVEANQPCTYAYSSNGTMGEQTEVTVGFVIDQMPSGDDITFNGQTFYFRGWTTDANDVTNLILAHSSYTVWQDVTFHAVYYQQVLSVEAEKYYAKVTRELPDWSGDYLIVYEDGKVAFDGGLETLDAASNTISVEVSNGIITASEALGAAKFTIAARDGGYSIQSASGKFIGRNADSNELDENTEYDENYVNVISYDVEEGIDIVGSGGAHLRFNKADNQNRFRYFKSSTYTSQQPIQLYRYVVNVSSLYTRVFVDNPSGDIVIAGPSIVPNGSVLNVSSITNTLGADRLVVEEGAQLVTSSNVDATIRKSINPYQGEFDNYYLISSPVNGQDPVAADMTDGGYDLYAFDQSAQGEEWQNYEANAFALQSGKGYLYANDYGGNIVMAGQMKGAAVNVTITHVSDKNLAGWNLIGNPYPCNVTIGKPYYRLAEGGAALATDATAESIAIAPMEGVFVYAEGEETVAFTKAPAISTTGSGRSTLNLRVSRNRSSKDDRVDTDNAIVRFGEGDMLRKLVLNPDLSQLYVPQGGIDYAIVNAEAEGEMPVSFRAAVNDSYTFSVAAEGVTMRYLHLIDLKTGADVDLLQTPYYTFTAQTTDYELRFRLVFATGSSTSSETGNFAYYNGSQWVVSSEADATLQVIDVMGRVLSSQNINGDAEVSIDRAAGVYLLRLINGSDVKVQKIVIH